MKKILFVDDSLTFTAMMSTALKVAGFAVTTVGVGKDVPALAKTGQPDLIILDMILPDGTGLDVLKLLKADPATQPIPVAILTGRENADEIGQLMEAGALAHLAKYKTTPKSLLEQVRGWLK